MPTWTINDVSFASLKLAQPQFTRGNRVPDVVTVDHLAASWDADPLFAYGEFVTIKRDGVVKFVGKRRLCPRFAGPAVESMAYTFAGPWDWLARTPLLQNQAVQPTDEEGNPVEGPPSMVPQGFVILNQGDDGMTVNLADALEVVLNHAIDSGVPILIGDITGFDYQVGWDEVADLNCGPAIERLLSSAPDAVVWFDYETAPYPTVHIGRRDNLEAVSLAIAPKGAPVSAFEAGTYAQFETIRLVEREDLIIPGAWITYRRMNVVNGVNYLALEEQVECAEGAENTDENALVRTVNLAGSVFSANQLEQKCVTAIIPVALAGPDHTDPITPAAGADFTAVLNFLGRAEGWLVEPGTTVSKLTPKGSHSSMSAVRRALTVDPETGEKEEVVADTSLVRELIEGNITPWMEAAGLGIESQEQEVCYEVECTRTIGGEVGKQFRALVTRAFRATDATTRVYKRSEVTDDIEQEETPTGLAAALYAALGPNEYGEGQFEGTFTLVERECSLNLHPGLVVNFTGGRAAWTRMNAVIQQVSAGLEPGTTQVTIGFPSHLGPVDLAEIFRLNRLKKPADHGLIRTTGIF